MQRIEALSPDTDAQPIATLFAAVKEQMGGVPNIIRTMGNSPVAVEAYLGFSGALGKGKLSAAEREIIALATAGSNGCDYCASAHTVVGGMAGLDKGEIDKALRGGELQGRNGALAQISRKIVDSRGNISDGDIAAFEAAGFSKGDLIEVLANVAANIFTNYFNHIAATDIDFPVVNAKVAETA